MNLFFNTIGFDNKEIADSIRTCNRQNQIVLLIFKEKKSLTPCECHKIFTKVKKNAPLTSIRRAINTLTSLGQLKKTNIKRIGIYGKHNYVWTIA